MFVAPTKCSSLEELLKEKKQDIQSLSKYGSVKTKIEEVSDAVIDGVPAKKIVTSGSEEGSNYRDKCIDWLILKEKKEYIITCAVSPPELYEKYTEFINKVIDSFEFI